jgi:hypothetical protein
VHWEASRNWDTCFVQIAVGKSVVAAATDLVKAITPAKRETWVHAEPFEWANESFAVAESAKAKYCVREGNSCEPPPSGSVQIDEAYLDATVPLIREQLQKGGVRLAHLLDAAWARAASASESNDQVDGASARVSGAWTSIVALRIVCDAFPTL